MRFRFPKIVKQDFVVIDSQFPQENPFAFRNAEINEYIKKIDNFTAYSMHVMHPDAKAGFGHSYGVIREDFEKNKRGYLQHYPGNSEKIKYLSEHTKYRFKLAYSFFLAETYVLLPFLEKNKIPFVFVLYPGGLFGLNVGESDAMIRRICDSKFFRGVIVTQKITEDYLLEKEFCKENLIHYIYGGFVQFKKEDVQVKKYYPGDKTTFDICFVAAKYSAKGVDKGYDIFIETAKILSTKYEDVRFHVVGGFDSTDIDVSTLQGKITFYGYKRPDFLAKFYASMDIFLAPNRPFQLFGGSFDGFPLGIDASYCGAALFVADQLSMNQHYHDGKDIVIVPLEPKQIAETIASYYNDLDNLYKLSRNGQALTQKVFDIDYQVEERMKVFSQHVVLDDTSKRMKNNA